MTSYNVNSKRLALEGEYTADDLHALAEWLSKSPASLDGNPLPKLSEL